MQTKSVALTSDLVKLKAFVFPGPTGVKQKIRLFSAFSRWRAEVSRCSTALGFNGTIFVWPGAEQMSSTPQRVALAAVCPARAQHASPLHNEVFRGGGDLFESI